MSKPELPPVVALLLADYRFLALIGSAQCKSQRESDAASVETLVLALVEAAEAATPVIDYHGSPNLSLRLRRALALAKKEDGK